MVQHTKQRAILPPSPAFVSTDYNNKSITTSYLHSNDFHASSLSSTLNKQHTEWADNEGVTKYHHPRQNKLKRKSEYHQTMMIILWNLLDGVSFTNNIATLHWWHQNPSLMPNKRTKKKSWIHHLCSYQIIGVPFRDQNLLLDSRKEKGKADIWAAPTTKLQRQDPHICSLAQ